MVGRSWRPAYPEALKQAAVLDLCNGEESAQEVADRLGVCRPTLYSWRNELLGHEAASSMKRRKTSAPAPEREELERQLEALQRCPPIAARAYLLKKANELLKKGPGRRSADPE
jgi:transposase-like protein